MAGWTAKLGGVHLNALNPLTWGLTYGVRPFVATIELTTERADQVFERAQTQIAAGRTRERGAPFGPLTLELLYPDDASRNVVQRGLFVLDKGEGDGLNTSTIEVTDRRWLAHRAVVRRRYNIRRDSGDRRLVKADLQPIQLGESAPDYVFKRITLNGDSPWLAEQVLADVLEEVFGPGGWRIPAGVAFALSDDVESLEFWDQGDEALARLSALIPGVRFYVDYNGLVTVANVYDRSESRVVAELGTQYEGDFRVRSRELLIPERFVVSIDAESEIRFDYTEQAVGSTVASVLPGREERLLQNMILCPLLELPLRNGEIATIGEAVPVDDFLTSVNDLKTADGITAPDLTQEILRRIWFGQWVGWTIQYLIDAENGGTRAKWSAIFTALRRHWRQTWRVLPQWVDKIRALSPTRAAILDAENGMRSAATVHTQWIQTLTQLGLDPRFGARQNLVNDDYAEDLGAQDGAQVSPFVVRMLSADQGLFRVEPRTDEDGLAQAYTLGTADESKLPSGDIRDAVVLSGQVELDGEFKLAVIMSAKKESPNGIGATHLVEVPIAEAAGALGAPTPTARGGSYELRAGEETARFAWVDAVSDQIEAAFFDGDQFPPELLVNESAVQSLALAHAARRLAVLLPRGVGTLRGRANGKIRPTGNLQQVLHTIRIPGDGIGAEGSTTLVMPQEVEAPSMWSLMPEGERRILRGQVQR